jgi:membrane fusion protein, multidrug efflux system
MLQRNMVMPLLHAGQTMKKFIAIFLFAIFTFACGIVFYAPFREAVGPYLPGQLRSYSPDKQATDNTNSTNAKRGGKAGGGPIAVNVVVAEMASLPLIERTYGVVKSPAIAAINARVTSQITEIHVQDGQMVKAGDLLISLDNKLMLAQLAKDEAILQKDQALQTGAEEELARAKGLAIKGAGTKQAYDQAVATQLSMAATVGADKATLETDQAQLAFTQITAPIDGRLGVIQAVVGNLVTAGGAGTAANNLMTITQLQPLKVGFQLPERVLTDVRAVIHDGAKMPVRILQSGTKTEIESGHLDFVDSAVDTTSGTIAMSASVANEKLTLWPGQFVDLEIDRGKLDHIIVVPTVAVQQSQTGPFVWVLKDDNTVAATPITVAHSENEKSAISSGLRAGERVVVEGQLKLKDGAAVKLGEPADATNSNSALPGTDKKSKKKTP